MHFYLASKAVEGRLWWLARVPGESFTLRDKMRGRYGGVKYLEETSKHRIKIQKKTKVYQDVMDFRAKLTGYA